MPRRTCSHLKTMLSSHLPEFFPITHCSQCGATVRRMADRLYLIDKQQLHVCKPEADGTPLTLYADPKARADA